MLLRVYSSGTVRVQRFDPAAGTLDSTALFTLPGGISATTGATAQDATNAYMVAYDASFAPSLYRLPLSATQADSAVQMTSEAGCTVTSLLFQTNNKVAFTAAAPPLGAALPSGTSLTPIAALGDKVFFNSAAASGARTARAFDEVGTSVIAQADADWLGFTDVGSTSTALPASRSAPCRQRSTQWNALAGRAPRDCYAVSRSLLGARLTARSCSGTPARRARWCE